MLGLCFWIRRSFEGRFDDLERANIPEAGGRVDAPSGAPCGAHDMQPGAPEERAQQRPFSR
jgi:hypothetical protein